MGDNRVGINTQTVADAMVALGGMTLDFGRVNRITYHQDGATPESDTDHTVMLGLIACRRTPRISQNCSSCAMYWSTES